MVTRRPQRPANMSDEELLRWMLAQGQASGECLLWPHASIKHGRGTIYFRGRVHVVARVLWFLTEGQWPKHNILHECDQPACFQKAHLFEGTQGDNMVDMATKRRHPTACKLTMQIARQIRADPRPNYKIAGDYGVSAAMVGRIKRDVSWVE